MPVPGAGAGAWLCTWWRQVAGAGAGSGRRVPVLGAPGLTTRNKDATRVFKDKVLPVSKEGLKLDAHSQAQRHQVSFLKTSISVN